MTGTQLPGGLGSGFKTLATGDLNGDGLTDFVMYRPADGTMYAGIGNGEGTFSYHYALVIGGFTSLQVGDFNGDRNADILFYRATDSVAYAGISDGSGGFAVSPVGTGPAYAFIETGDINHNGKADIVLYSSASGNAQTGISTGSGFTFSALPASPGFTSIAMLDYNGDGFADLALYNRNTAVGYLLIGDGTGGFTANSLFRGAGMQPVQISDLNGDSKPDVVIYDTNNAAYTASNTGSLGSPFTYTFSFWGTGRVLATTQRTLTPGARAFRGQAISGLAFELFRRIAPASSLQFCAAPRLAH